MKKSSNIKLLLVVLMMFFTSQLMAQVTVTGTVVDDQGLEAIGATVLEKGTQNATVTDNDGNFTIKVKSSNAVLQVSYVGFTTQDVKVGGKKNLSITLQSDAKMLEETVVVGYGRMKRSDLTGAVSSINEEQIKQGVNTSLEQAMQGRIAGVNVTQNSGAPGGGISVQIRGINSLNGNEPLYVVDGIAMSGQTSDNTSVLASINPSDITSIEVLKDASATAIYGSRASNGVVLITTKRGQDGKAKINYEGYMGWQSLPKQLKMMNLPQYADFYNTRAEIYGWGARDEYSDPSLLTEGTNWQDVLFQTAFMHNHQLGVSGGTKDMNYNLSGGYLNQEGIGLGSSFNRASFRANFDTKVTSWVKVGVNAYFARTNQLVTFDDASVISTALEQYPDVAPKNPDGTFGSAEDNEYNYYSNPLFDATMRDNHKVGSQFDYNAYATITPLKNLQIRLEYGGSLGWGDNYYFVPQYQYGKTIVESKSERTSSTNKYQSFKQYATYDFDPFVNNHFQIMAGHEAQWGSWANLSGSRKGYISDAIHSLAVGDATTATNNEQGSEWSIESYYGRLNYNYNDRYLLTATLRTDGSSSFGKNNRWGWFPSAALAWRVNNESFLKNVDWLSNLKLRLGWGLVGNQSTGSYAYGVAMGSVATAWGTGYYAGNYANPDLRWESTNSWNAGVDMAFLKNRIELIVDAYYKNTDNLLMQASLPTYIVDVDGYRGIRAPYVNSGAIRNKGIEFTLNTVNITKKDWEWRTGVTVSFNRNELTALNSEDAVLYGTVGSNTYTISQVGQPVGLFYGYNCIGMFQNEGDFYRKNSLGEFLLDANGDRIPVARPVDTNGNLQPIATNGIWVGDYMWEDVNGDGKITEADRKVIGDPNPDFTFGINNTIKYKQFELSFFINGSVGNDVYNILRQNHTNPTSWGNKMAYCADYARIGMYDETGALNDISNVYVINPNAAIERISASGSTLNDNERVSSRFVEDGSYVRLKSLSFAWNLPWNWIHKAGLEWVQLYVNAQNLFTITGYDGYDPEVGATGQSVILQGLDNGRYPSQRIYNIGVKLNF